jgi:hypothetical protein
MATALPRRFEVGPGAAITKFWGNSSAKIAIIEKAKIIGLLKNLTIKKFSYSYRFSYRF